MAAAKTPRGTPRPIPTLALELKPWDFGAGWAGAVEPVEAAAVRVDDDELLDMEFLVADADLE